MSLEAFQSGLSWLIILRKRDNFRAAFDRFDIETVARHRPRRHPADGRHRHRAQPGQDRGHHRQRPARRGRPDIDLSDLLWSYAPPPRPRPRTLADVPSLSPESQAMAKDLKNAAFASWDPPPHTH